LPPGLATGVGGAHVSVAQAAPPAPSAGIETSDREDCADDAENSDQKIAGCSRVIVDNTANTSKRAQAYRSRGAAYYDKSDYDRAIADFSEAMKLDPNIVPPSFALAYNRRGLAYVEKKDYDLAIADYGEAIKLDSSSAEVYKNRGTAYNIKQDYDRAIPDFDQALKLDPNYAIAYNNRGFAYFRKNDTDRAIADYSEALKHNPNYAIAYNNRGNAYFRRSDYDRSIADYSEAVKHNPNYAIAYDNRGNAYLRKNDYDRAIADYDEAVRLNPRLAVPHAHRCNVYYSMRNYDAAIADCSEAIRLNPKDDFSRSTLANAAAGKRDYEAVSVVMNRLSINLPTDVAGNAFVKKSLGALNREPCDQQAILDLGAALDGLDRKREAANAQLRFSAACGGYAASVKAAAKLLLELADHDGAAAAAAELIKLDPHNNSGFYLRAVAYDRGGSTKKAIDDYLTAIELAENKVNISSEVYLAVARNYEKLGQFCDARSIVEAWVALNPTRNDSDRMQAFIADYTAKGKCDVANSRAEEVFRSQNNAFKLPVMVNGVRGTFILDTGATFVTMKRAFAEKAKVQIDQDSNVKMHSANGEVDGKRGRATTIQLRSLQAKDVVVVMQTSGQSTYGEGVDGLLGLSFLSRFNVSIDAQTVRIANRHPK